MASPSHQDSLRGGRSARSPICRSRHGSERVDCSHANSGKDYKLQRKVLIDVAGQVKNGSNIISGVMLESFITGGNQKPAKPEKLTYGQSITDGCLDWDENEELINLFADAVKL